MNNPYLHYDIHDMNSPSLHYDIHDMNSPSLHYEIHDVNSPSLHYDIMDWKMQSGTKSNVQNIQIYEDTKYYKETQDLREAVKIIIIIICGWFPSRIYSTLVTEQQNIFNSFNFFVVANVTH